MLNAILALLAVGTAAITVPNVASIATNKSKVNTQKSYNNMVKVLKNKGLENVRLEDIVAKAFAQHQISEEDYNKFMGIAKEVPNMKEYYKDQAESTSPWDFVTDYNAYVSKAFSSKYGKDGKRFFDLIAANADSYIRDVTNGEITGASIANAFLSGTPDYTIAAPNYIAMPDEYQIRDIDPVKRWTGPELAEFHDIPYDVAEYYDILKEGTSAAVDYAKYQNAQANEASMFQDEAQRTSYLDAIRNTRADAIANGATLGAKYANELLANREAMSNYSTAQAEVANNAVANLESPIREDAYAQTTTRNYFDSLANNLENVINQLYYNDSVRYGQDWLNEATRYESQQGLRGDIAQANANMYANYVANAASVNAANAGRRAQANDYAFLFDNVILPAYDYDNQAAVYAFDNYLQQLQTGRTAYQNLISNYNNNNN